MTGDEVQPRPPTERERVVLDVLLAVGAPGADDLRAQLDEVQVVGGCPCGYPSVDFAVRRGAGLGVLVDAAVRGSGDGLFVFTVPGADGTRRLGGIEYVGYGEQHPAELPSPDALEIRPAAR